PEESVRCNRARPQRRPGGDGKGARRDGRHEKSGKRRRVDGESPDAPHASLDSGARRTRREDRPHGDRRSSGRRHSDQGGQAMSERIHDVISTPGAVPIKAWTRGVMIEPKAREQLLNVARLPFIHGWVAAMPDVHWGIGATVGSVIPTVGAVIPAAVGVDIGCGMVALRTSLKAEDLPENLKAIRTAIEAAGTHDWTDKGGAHNRGGGGGGGGAHPRGGGGGGGRGA